jgi:hypothetical protein
LKNLAQTVLQLDTPPAIGKRHNRTPADSPPPPRPLRIRACKVVALFNDAGASWADFETHGFPCFATAHWCDYAGGNVGSSTIKIELCRAPDDAASGALPAVGDVLLAILGDGRVAVPGTSNPVEHYDGHLVPGVLQGYLTAKVID